MSLVNNLTELLTPAVTQAGFVLEEVTVTPVGKRRLVAVVVDCEDRNPSLDEVTVVSKEVSAILDNYTQMGEMPFTLEVTTPGIDRPLTLGRHWKKNIGRLVKITPKTGEKYIGRIASVNDNAVTIEIKGKESEISFAEISRAQIEVELNGEIQTSPNLCALIPAGLLTTSSALVDCRGVGLQLEMTTRYKLLFKEAKALLME